MCKQVGTHALPALSWPDSIIDPAANFSLFLTIKGQSAWKERLKLFQQNIRIKKFLTELGCIELFFQSSTLLQYDFEACIKEVNIYLTSFQFV
jgi:hypothetical protein